MTATATTTAIAPIREIKKLEMPTWISNMLDLCKKSINTSEIEGESDWLVYHDGRWHEEYDVHIFDFVRLDGGIYKEHLETFTGFIKMIGYGSWYITKRNGMLCVRVSVYIDKD